jgi:hypothetical protein
MVVQDTLTFESTKNLHLHSFYLFENILLAIACRKLKKPLDECSCIAMNRQAHATMMDMFHGLIQAGMSKTVKQLGRDLWTRCLNDETLAFGFCLPTFIYEDADSYEVLRTYLVKVFASVGLGIHVHLRASSNNEDGEPLYMVDVNCAVVRTVHVGPHLYVEFYPLATIRDCVDGDGPDFGRIWILERTAPDANTDCFNVRVLEPVSEKI